MARAARLGACTPVCAPETRAAGDERRPCDRIVRSYSAFLLELLCTLLVTFCLAAFVNCTARTCILKLRPHCNRLYAFLCRCSSPALILRIISKYGFK